jgi:hypothetical protein
MAVTDARVPPFPEGRSLQGTVSWEMLALIGTVAGSAIALTWTIAGKFNGVKTAIKDGLRALEDKLCDVREELFVKIDASEKNSMSSRVSQAWYAAEMNPGMKIPDPRDPGRQFFVVERGRDDFKGAVAAKHKGAVE